MASLRTAIQRSTLGAVGLLLAASVLLVACGDDEPETGLTVESQLEAVAGQELTPAEIARQVEIASTLCGMSDEVLVAIWDRLNEDQLAFQDFVFGSHCPERSVAYGLATGRALTPEARVATAEQQATVEADTESTILLPQRTTTTTPTGGTTSAPGDVPGASISIQIGDP